MEKIDIFTSITNEEKEKWSEITLKECNEYLTAYSLKIPEINSNKFLQLVCLRMYTNKLVSKEVISQFVRFFNKNASVDQQSRHLGSQDFFYVLNAKEKIPNIDMIVPVGYHILITLETPHPKFIHASHKRAGRFAAKNFDELKRSYNNRCATCGSLENKPHFKDASKKTLLQQGHIDPLKSLTIDNTIPQCQLCNQTYKDNFVFNEEGRVIAVASLEPIVKAHKSVKEKILDFLLNQKDNKGE
jgi:hypothetical protein